MRKVQKMNSLPKAEFTLSSSNKNRKNRRGEFQEVLDAYMTETADDLDSYSLQLPKHGPFWDDGYKDVRFVGHDHE